VVIVGAVVDMSDQSDQMSDAGCQMLVLILPIQHPASSISLFKTDQMSDAGSDSTYPASGIYHLASLSSKPLARQKTYRQIDRED
jgi:hypothetical protein